MMALIIARPLFLVKSSVKTRDSAESPVYDVVLSFLRLTL